MQGFETRLNFSDGITVDNSIISKQVEKKKKKKKIEEMKLPEKLTYTLPTSDASSMKIFAKLLSGKFKTLPETEQLKVILSFESTCDASSFNCTCYTNLYMLVIKGSKRHPVIIFFSHRPAYYLLIH